MPIIKSAKKRMRQDDRKRTVNHATLANMRSLYKNIIAWATAGDKDNCAAFFSKAQKAVDTCAKKSLIHKKNAANKKSRMAKMIAGLGITTVTAASVAVAVKKKAAAPKKKTAVAKKAPAKKTAAKTEKA